MSRIKVRRTFPTLASHHSNLSRYTPQWRHQRISSRCSRIIKTNSHLANHKNTLPIILQSRSTWRGRRGSRKMIRRQSWGMLDFSCSNHSVSAWKSSTSSSLGAILTRCCLISEKLLSLFQSRYMSSLGRHRSIIWQWLRSRILRMAKTTHPSSYRIGIAAHVDLCPVP